MTPSVVCGVDHSPHARTIAACAADLAERLELRLVLVHAVPVTVPPVAPSWPARAPYDPAELRSSAHGAGKRRLAEMMEAAGDSSAMCRLEDGPPAECLGMVADQEAADFIVIGTQGEGAAHVMVMGSVSLAIVRRASCPVMVVPPTVIHAPLTAPEVETVVCGIGDADDAEPVRIAIRLARDLELSLLTAHVVPSEDEPTSARTVAGIRTLVTDRLPATRAAGAQTALKSTIDAAGAARAALDGPAILVGEPAEELAQFAADARAAVVVVGSRGRGPIRSSVLGSVSRAQAWNSTCPVRWSITAKRRRSRAA